jgi:hypothetical protein
LAWRRGAPSLDRCRRGGPPRALAAALTAAEWISGWPPP